MIYQIVTMGQTVSSYIYRQEVPKPIPSTNIILKIPFNQQHKSFLKEGIESVIQKYELENPNQLKDGDKIYLMCEKGKTVNVTIEYNYRGGKYEIVENK